MIYWGRFSANHYTYITIHGGRFSVNHYTYVTIHSEPSSVNHYTYVMIQTEPSPVNHYMHITFRRDPGVRRTSRLRGYRTGNRFPLRSVKSQRGQDSPASARRKTPWGSRGSRAEAGTGARSARCSFGGGRQWQGSAHPSASLRGPRGSRPEG